MKADLFYKTFNDIFIRDLPAEPPGNSDKFIQILIHLHILLQHIHLFWHPSLPINEFQNYLDFWRALSYPCMDSLFAHLNILLGFILISLAGVCILFLMCATAVIIEIKKEKIPRAFCKILRLIFFVFSHLYFIPITIGFLLMFKYSNSSLTVIEEYENNLPTSTIDFGSAGVIAAPILLAIHLSLALVYECCHFEMDHFRSKKDILAKSAGEFDALTKIVSFINCLLFMSMIRSNYVSYLLLVGFMQILVTVKIGYYMPNYAEIMNLLKILVQGLSTMIIMFFLLGWVMDDSAVVFILTIFLQPVLIIIGSFCVKYRYESILKAETNSISSFLIFELAHRSFLISGEKKESMIDLLNNNYKLSKDKRSLVIQANYSKLILNNPMLGLMRISQTNHYGLNIFINYHIFKCKEEIQSINSISSDGYKLFLYFNEFRLTKKQDLELCEDFMNLLEKILEKDPELSTLKELTNNTYQTIISLNKKYTNLLKMMPDSRVVIDMYASLQTEILGDQEKGKILFNKRSGLNKKEASHKKKYSMTFEETSCVLLASASQKPIGKVLYANSALARFLGYTVEAINDCYLKQFVPKPFIEMHDQQMKMFVENSTTHHVFRSTPLFMSCQNGFLVECYFNSECIGYEGELYFLSLIDPIRGKKREVAIINEYGMIYSHSENFSGFFDVEDKNLENRYVEEFLPGLKVDKNFLNYLFMFSMNNRNKERAEIGVVIKEKTISSCKFLALYVSSDIDEINRWRSTFFSELTDHEEKRYGTLIKASDYEVSDTEKPKEKMNEEQKIQPTADEEGAADDRKNQTGSSSIPKKQTTEYKLLAKALNSLSTMKYLILASVITIIAYNIFIMVYISQAVNHANSLDTLNQLGDLAYTSAQIALIARSIDISLQSGSQSLFSIDSLELRISQIKILQQKLLNDYDSWSFCEYSKMVKQPIISYWDFIDLSEAKHESLHMIIGLIIQNAQEFVTHIKSNSTDYKQNLFFLVYNGIGKSFKVTKDAMVGLTKCEIDRVMNLNDVRMLLMIVAIAVSGVLAFFLSIYVFSADKTFNNLWELLRKRAHSGYYDFRFCLLDRLNLLHDQPNNYEEIEASVYKQSHQIKYWHSAIYLKRFAFFFISAGVLYIVTSYVFYQKIHNYLYYRPTLMYTIIIRRVSITELCFFSNENEILNSNFSLTATFPEINCLSPPIVSYKLALANLLLTKNTMREERIRALMSPGLENKIFQYIENVPTFLSLGTYTAMAYLNTESQFITFNKIQDNYVFLANYVNEMMDMTDMLKNVSLNCNSDSKDLIALQLKNLSYFISCFSLAALIYYFGYYRPYLSNEQLIVKRVTEIIQIIPLKPSFSQGSTKRPNS